MEDWILIGKYYTKDYGTRAHVHRICNWLKLVRTSKPVETEMALRKILPVRYRKTWNSHLVSIGQTRCDPVRPKCDGCPIARHCHSPKKRPAQ